MTALFGLVKAGLAAVSVAALVAKYAPWIRGALTLAGWTPLLAPAAAFGRALAGAFWAVVNNPFTSAALVMVGFALGFGQGDKWRYRQVAAIYAELEASNARLAAYEARDEAEAARAAAARAEAVKAARLGTAGFTCVVPSAALADALARIGR
ncbi:MAG TPA: hypothetical protein VNK48_14355 [Xanthobacteraceae bacterium]|nr:hypothetical protein [Xanthobacteraceae bacterium]